MKTFLPHFNMFEVNDEDIEDDMDNSSNEEGFVEVDC